MLLDKTAELISGETQIAHLLTGADNWWSQVYALFVKTEHFYLVGKQLFPRVPAALVLQAFAWS